MKIYIHEVVVPSSKSCEVIFSCAAGEGRSRWSGRDRPQVGESYDVELDVDESIELGRNATFFERGGPGFSLAADNVVLTGTIESRDEDGMTFLRLANDCLLMMDSEDNLPIGENVRISLPCDALELTPFGAQSGHDVT